MCYTSVGDFDVSKAGHEEVYYVQRYAFLDLRGDVKISRLSYWGFGCKVVSQTHGIVSGEFTPQAQNRRVVVDDYAWIGSFAMLYDCHIMHHGIVGAGAVVKRMTVEPYTIVEGNPARVVSRWNGEKWERV